ncbi:hypothetical protein HPB51_022511 [Rhipicephalus microplus]|uniref:Endonuclease/exonuclease/phosphatase domain-containing protein n=1 Tax=Rhipicephalus microplus TaxID=6941 RepID=A0A9J6ED15_RHIMP|nr:hypothetical protein HPB51_022511 [Rhipicephalus microplus]
MAKGIIRNIPLKYTHDKLMHALVNARNPSLAYAKSLGSTITVILLYEGIRVPNAILRKATKVGCVEKRGRTPSGSRLTRPGHLGKQQHTTSPSTHIKVQIQIQVQAGSLGTTSLRVKVQKQTQDQERVEIHLEGKDARSDNEAARRTEDARQGDNRLVIGGDFNAPHTQWGYGHSSKQAKNLADLIEKAELIILNEPALHTRIGVGPHRDTTPDLTLCKNAGRITWENTFEDLGSDYRILSITLGNPLTSNCKRTIRRVY